MPTNSNAELGNKNWGLGPSFVVLHLDKGDPWVYGVLVNNIWSLTSDQRGGSYNNGLIQPFVNYNFEGGFYLTSAPILTIDWKADSGQQWTVPLGGGVGKIFHLGKLPVNTQLSAYYNVATPDDGADWQIRAQVQLMFPKYDGSIGTTGSELLLRGAILARPSPAGPAQQQPRLRPILAIALALYGGFPPSAVP